MLLHWSIQHRKTQKEKEQGMDRTNIASIVFWYITITNFTHYPHILYDMFIGIKDKFNF